MTVPRFFLRVLDAWISRRIIAVIGAPPPPPPFIVTANHTSYFDHAILGFWLLSNGRPYPKFLSKAELFEKPLSAWFNRLGGGIPVSREAVDTDAFSEAKAVLDSGGIVVMYAEGTRSRDGRMRAPRRGIASLAAEANVPVLPVGLLGVREVLPIGSKWPRRKRRIVIHAGNAVLPPMHERHSQLDFVRQTFRQIAGLSAQWPGFIAEPEYAPVSTPPQRDEASSRAGELVERGFESSGDEATAYFRDALAARPTNNPYCILERGRAYGQLARLHTNPLSQLRYALASKRAIWKAVRALPTVPLAWHVWASLMEQLPPWLGGDIQAAHLGHRVAVTLDPTWSRGIAHIVRINYEAGRLAEADRWQQSVTRASS